MNDETSEPLRNSGGTAGNLKPFAPGRSGNPGGRPRGKSPSRMLAKVATVEQLKAICEKILALSAAGDIQAARLLFDRLDGRAPDSILLSIGQSPKPNELPDDFFERLVSDAETTCKRAFPQWDRAAEVVTLKWNAASEANNAPPMIIEIVRPCPVCEKETAPGCPETSRNVSSATLTPSAPPHEPTEPPPPPPKADPPQFREAYQRPSRCLDG